MAGSPKNSTKRRSDGDGSVYQRHSPDCPRPVNGKGKPSCKCRWVGAIVLTYIDGKPVRRKVSANTESGAAAAVRELRERHAAEQLPAAGKPITVEKWMLHWLTQIAPRRVGSELTISNSYDTKVRQYIIPLLGRHRLDQLTPEHIEAAWDVLRATGNPTGGNGQPLADSTVLQTHRILSRALKVAVQRKRIRHNPADSNSMDAPTAEEKEMSLLTIEEARAVLAAATQDRMEARWVIALALGLRQGEALGLRWDDVDLDDSALRVRQALKRVKGKGLVFGAPKSRRSKRDVALPAEVLTVLKAHRKRQLAERVEHGSEWHDFGLVFAQPNGKPIDPSRDSRNWHALLTRADVPAVRLHDARHTAATIMLLMGVDARTVMETLGHSQIGVTMKYQHVVDQLKRDAADKMGAALWG
jgi:integrase